eukprot:6199281-Pleurochrysis_carterae.AAC.2
MLHARSGWQQTMHGGRDVPHASRKRPPASANGFVLQAVDTSNNEGTRHRSNTSIAGDGDGVREAHEKPEKAKKQPKLERGECERHNAKGSGSGSDSDSDVACEPRDSGAAKPRRQRQLEGNSAL